MEVWSAESRLQLVQEVDEWLHLQALVDIHRAACREHGRVHCRFEATNRVADNYRPLDPQMGHKGMDAFSNVLQRIRETRTLAVTGKVDGDRAISAIETIKDWIPGMPIEGQSMDE